LPSDNFQLNITNVTTLILLSIDKKVNFLLEIFTESQNHRMVGVGRDLCGSSSPTLLDFDLSNIYSVGNLKSMGILI